MCTSSHANAKYAPGFPSTSMNIPPSHVSPFHGTASATGSRLRGQYDLEEAPCANCLVHFCCETCSLCQEYRKLKNHGFDMGIGSQANMDRQGRGNTVGPVVGRMTR
ncbi:hypothetical protein CRYUN_Cryun24cG0066000 [Craigia yunnanensis]